jgi:hypothetical protein
MRHESFIELIGFYQNPWSNFRLGNARPDGQAIQQHLLPRLRALVEQGVFGEDKSKDRFEELANRFRLRFDLRA